MLGSSPVRRWRYASAALGRLEPRRPSDGDDSRLGGHQVETLGGSWLSLCRHTRYVSHIHSVPAYGRDPLGWLSVASDICARRRIRVLIPTQEQAAVLAAFPGAIRGAGTAIAVPSFERCGVPRTR